MTALITRSELEELIAANAVVVLDTLPEAYFAQVHLPGALNLVETNVDTLAASLIPTKDSAVVTYCSNAACGNSQAVANRLERLGYTNVRKYRDGIQDWVEAGNPVESAA